MRQAPSDAPSVTIAVDDPALVRDPYPALNAMRAQGPVVWNCAVGLFVVTGYDDVVQLLMDPERFSSRRDVDAHEHLAPEAREILARGYAERSILVNDDGPKHTRLRALVNKAFSRSDTAALEESIHAVAKTMVSRSASSPTIDVIRELAAPLPLTVICSIIGVDPDRAAQLKAWSHSWAALTHDRSLARDEQVRCAEDLLAWQRFMGELVEARRSAPRDDLASGMIASREEGVEPLTTPEIAVFLMGLLFAGHETTTNLIGNAVVNIFRHDLWRRLADDPRLVAPVLDETLRFDPPVQGMLRRATRDTVVAGVRIPRGESVLLSFAAANRDPSRHRDPDRFDIDRSEPVRHLGFGRGIHYCLGAPLAKVEARAALLALLSTRPHARLEDGEIGYRPSLVHRGPISVSISSEARPE